VTRDDAQAWLDGYVEAWRSDDPAVIAALFSDDALYRYDPFRDPIVGGAAIAADWLQSSDAPGSWEAEYRPYAVDGNRAVAVGETRYTSGEHFANVFVLEFADDGRCSSFTEWFFLEGASPPTGAG
jgi:SnoaL-like domain